MERNAIFWFIMILYGSLFEEFNPLHMIFISAVHNICEFVDIQIFFIVGAKF